MTDTEFRQQYRFVKLISEQGSRTYHALDAAGRAVLVHYLPAGSPETQRLLALLDATPAAAPHTVQRVDVDGAPVLVTEAIPDFQSLAIWLHGFPKPRAAAPGGGAGDMTQLFGPSAPTPAPSPPTAKTPAPAPPPTAGEATLVVEPITERHVPVPPPTPPLPSPPPARPAPPAPPAPPTHKPAEKKPNIRWREASDADRPADVPVVRWKKDGPPVPEPPPPVPAPPPAPLPLPRSAAPKQVGEFTQLFGPGSGSTPAPSAPEPAPAKEAPRAPSSRPPHTPAPPDFGGPPRTEPGEFTRLFNPESRPDPSPPPRPQSPPRDLLQELNAPASPPPSVSTPPPAAPASAPGEFTQMMAGVSPPAAAKSPPSGSPGPAAGPSDFTRMIKGLAPRAAAAPAATPSAKTEPAAPEESPRSRRLVVLVIVLGTLAVFAIGLVLYFVLRAP